MSNSKVVVQALWLNDVESYVMFELLIKLCVQLSLNIVEHNLGIRNNFTSFLGHCQKALIKFVLCFMSRPPKLKLWLCFRLGRGLIL